ncbi:Transmembrane protein [Trema orientale]|uniref:Transmembrane protein n=1 Tax=Trema orientale TaxID=63057 RepID=A0A2P5CF77_TREOI|nr:Transmembrane protein [Trema orientale]
MAVKVSSSFSCLSAALSSPLRTRSPFQLSLSRGLYNNQQHEGQLLRHTRVSEEQSQHDEVELVASEQENHHPNAEDVSTASRPNFLFDGTGGKPGLVSFYNRPYKREDEIRVSSPGKNHNNLLWFIGPAVLVASFVFPSLYLRRMLSAVFEDSLLTDFLILFFTEALFYCGVAVFLLLIDHLRRPAVPESTANGSKTLTPHFSQRIFSVAALVLSLIIPMVTMGLVWPWTGPAASATLAPYLVGIVVQFAFEQYARYTKSPSWPVIPIIFQVYRLHQLNRAAQLVTALSFTVRGAEMTSHNLAINSSLGTLLNVLQCLGVICIWSLSSFLMRFFPLTAVSSQ